MEIISKLIEAKEETLRYFGLDESLLQKTYQPGKWSVKRILVHLADAESVLHERIKRTISEPNPLISAFDQDLWCQKLEYDHFPIEISKELYIANRNSIIYLAQHYYISHGHLQFQHSEMGIRTLKDEFDKVVWHNIGHLDQIKKAIELTF